MSTRAKKQTKSVLPPLPTNLDINSNNFYSTKDLSKLSEEGSLIVEIIMEKFDKLSQDITSKIEANQEKFDEMEREIRSLKNDNSEVRERLDGIEARERNDSVIISGAQLPKVTPDENPVGVSLDMFERVLKLKTNKENIRHAYRIGKSKSLSDDRRSILVKFTDVDMRNDIVAACRTVKPPGIYVNENLIPVRAEIFSVLRHAKRRYPTQVAAVGTRNGDIYVWLKSPNGERNQKLFLNTKSKLADFCENTLHISVANLTSERT